MFQCSKIWKNTYSNRYELAGNWTLHQDNAHVATYVQQYASKCNINIVPHPRCRPVLAIPSEPFDSEVISQLIVSDLFDNVSKKR